MTIEQYEKKYGTSICDNVEIISNCLNDNDILIDIGANTGLLSVKLLEKNPKVRFILFEPIKKYFDACVNKFGDKENVEVFNLGFSDENKKHKFYCSKLNYGYNKIFEDTMEIHPNFVEEIDCIRFSDWVGDREVNFIKIDAEGHDTNIIKGMYDWLDNLQHLPYILFEGGWYEDLETETINKLKNVYSYNIRLMGRDVLAVPKVKQKNLV